MHVALDLNWFLQFVALALTAAFGFLYLVRNTASRYFVVDSNFDSTSADLFSDRKGRASMASAAGGAPEVSDACAVCGRTTSKQCARCKMVKYCSETCQSTHWKCEHKSKCKDLQSLDKANNTKLSLVSKERKASLVPATGSSKIYKKPNKILFPYEEFVRYFDWDKSDYPPPCGLLNCGNSCFANVVLQCLSYTRPLVAYLLEKGHKKECQMDKWCFFCEFQTHVERAIRSVAPFSPMNILARLRNIGGNLGYGQQEDAHEFIRFAIDTMQSVCLDEFGGEKTVHPSYQLTTLIQHIFGGRLQSQVVCTECNNVSNQFENMMDLTVEIHGDAETLEECLDQYTAKERLHGDNMYKCDGCNAYVTAWKRLSVQQAPNILTIALKRFQSGRFGKLNKRVTFPEKLNLKFYMSELEDGNDYMLYAVIVHLDMLNASFFGHYICYVKDFGGNWYKIDDCEVARVDLEEVLSQGAYMLLYRRIHARASCLLPVESLKIEENKTQKMEAVDPSVKQQIECLAAAGGLDNPIDSGHLSSADCSGTSIKIEQLSITHAGGAGGELKMESSEASLPMLNGEVHNMEVEPKQDGSSVNHTVEPMPAGASLSDNSSMELDANNSTCSVSSHDDGENESKVIAKTKSGESCETERGNKSDVSPFATTEDQQLNSVNATTLPDNTECTTLAPMPDKSTKKAAKCSNGGSSGAKLKPVFVPGFLGKHPRKDLKQKNKVPSEAGGRAPKPNKAGQDAEKSCIDGRLSTEAAAVNKSLENGDSFHPSSCSQCKHQNSHNKRNAGKSRAAKPCC